MRGQGDQRCSTEAVQVRVGVTAATWDLGGGLDDQAAVAGLAFVAETETKS